ncbi:MAG TPA: TIGR00725 family protein [Phycisphaerae bacterium]|nr:TIGR00725 family protein [Phycisphaerae bacterium]HRW54340.1 TIGR00725 family protein [Phycisphaerae bacterium]
MRRPQIGIMGSSEANEIQRSVAERAGRCVAQVGAALVTGGRDGVMQAAAKGCAEAGGIVIAVTPFTPMEQVNEYTHYVIPTGLGWARNVITAISGDIILVVGGAAGTLSEIAYAWMYDRPIVALSESGGWAKKLAGERIDHRREDCIVDCDDVNALEPILRKLLAERPIKTIPPVGRDAP